MWLITGEGNMIYDSGNDDRSNSAVVSPAQQSEKVPYSTTNIETNLYKQLLKEKEKENYELLKKNWELENELKKYM